MAGFNVTFRTFTDDLAEPVFLKPLKFFSCLAVSQQRVLYRLFIYLILSIYTIYTYQIIYL